MDGATMALGEQQVAAAWDGNAATWVEHVRSGYDLYREAFTLPAFLGFSPDLGGSQVIDLGCGEGHNTRALARRGARMTGVDLSPKMIAAARASEAAAPLGIVYHIGSFTRLDFCEDASFDAAVSTMALMDGPDFAAAARAAHRVLRPGGGFYFSVLHPCFITSGAKWLRDERGRGTHLTVADYFADRAYVEHWRFKAPESGSAEPFQVPRFGQRLEDYVNGLCAAGFRITRLAEPRPTAAQCAAHPWLARWRRHAALVLLIAAIKD
jgi:SAM-dependent methyltransferase